MNKFQTNYLTEVKHRILGSGFTAYVEKGGLLTVEWAGSHVCNVNGDGGMIYDREQVRKNGLEDALDLVSNPEQGKLLEGVMEQIEEAVPQVIELANELTQSPKPGGMQLLFPN